MDEPKRTKAPDTNEVLLRLDWVRGLALQVVGGPNAAQSLRRQVQLMAEGLEQPHPAPAGAGPPEQRRADPAPPASDLLATIECAGSHAARTAIRELALHQDVVDCLLRLEEPHRTILVAVYFEDLSPEEVADREDVTITAVRNGLERGQAELRKALDERVHGESTALVALARHVWGLAGAGSDGKPRP